MKHKIFLYSYILLVLVYIGINLFIPADPETLSRFNISETTLRLIMLTIQVPLFVVWASAAYAFLRFDEYTDLISTEREAQPFRKLTLGLMILAFALPITSILSAIFRYISRENPAMLDTTTVIGNYLNLLFSAAAIILLARGIDHLLGVTKPRAILPRIKHGEFMFIAFSSLYTWLVIETISRTSGADNVYHMPVWLVIVTLVIPYLIVWYIGAQAVYRLRTYRDTVPGVVYKKAMNSFVRGIAAIIILSLSLQLLGMFTAQLASFNLSALLALVYLLLLLYIAGYGLVAYSARQLKKIEEV